MSTRREKKLQKRERRRLRVTSTKSGDRIIHLDNETHDALEKLHAEFVAKFGREPGPDDPIFFDPDADTPKPIDAEKLMADLTGAMAKAGIEPEKIYAFNKTGGLMVTRENWPLLSSEDQQAWNDAIDEYEHLTEGRKQ
jgi:hypothetical protein